MGDQHGIGVKLERQIAGLHAENVAAEEAAG
jgi:hypothetical protein